MSWIAAALTVVALQAGDAETRIVDYLKANVVPGERVIVSDLYNEVFTTPEERAVLDRLFNTFFKIPLYIAQYNQSAGQPPTLAELSEQFGFAVPGQADVILRILESDPRIPSFFARDRETGEIVSVDVEAIRGDARFGKLLERSLAGWVGKAAPPFALAAIGGEEISTAALRGKGHLVYFWFTACPPCVKTTPLLVELYEKYAPRGFEIVALNADRFLELPYTDEHRAAYIEKLGIRFPVAHLTAEVQQAYGAVSVFPTLFFVDGQGLVVEHNVNFQDRDALETAIEKTLE